MGKIIAGIDEVGVGALAGPIVSSIFVISDSDLKLFPPGVTDSKKLSKDRINEFYFPLCHAALEIGIGSVSAKEIDAMGLTKSLQLCYSRAFEEISTKTIESIQLLYVDGKFPIKAFSGKQVVEPRADSKYKVVSAASIIAKFTRDKVMVELSKTFPSYKWEDNKGYGSLAHRKAIQRHGLIVNDKFYLHRRRWCKFSIRATET